MNKTSDSERISMQIITYSGLAKSFAVQAMDQAEKGLPYEEILKTASENLLEANKIHFEAIQIDAKKGMELNVLFIHAEDQMLSAETILIMSKRIVGLYERLK